MLVSVCHSFCVVQFCFYLPDLLLRTLAVFLTDRIFKDFHGMFYGLADTQPVA